MNSNISKLSVRLLFKGLKLVSVESLTGGLIAKQATDRSGSSEWFEAGLVTYSAESKSKLANVPKSIIDQYGVVSSQTACAMAEGAARLFKHCVVVSVTGVAGPAGGDDKHPVGTVFVACHAEGKTRVKTFLFQGNREQIRSQTVTEAINLALAELKN